MQVSRAGSQAHRAPARSSKTQGLWIQKFMIKDKIQHDLLPEQQLIQLFVVQGLELGIQFCRQLSLLVFFEMTDILTQGMLDDSQYSTIANSTYQYMKPNWLSPGLEKQLFQVFKHCCSSLGNPISQLFTGYISEAAVYWYAEAKDKMEQFKEEKKSIIDQIIAIRSNLVVNPSIDKLLSQFALSLPDTENLDSELEAKTKKALQDIFLEMKEFNEDIEKKCFQVLHRPDAEIPHIRDWLKISKKVYESFTLFVIGSQRIPLSSIYVKGPKEVILQRIKNEWKENIEGRREFERACLKSLLKGSSC